MGKFTFDIPAELPPALAAATEGAWLSSGYDHWPIPTERSSESGKLVLERVEKESATFGLLFPDAHGTRAIATSTLRPNGDPYQVVIELARGVINRLRNVVTAFATAGLALPADFQNRVRLCTMQLGRAISVADENETTRLGSELIVEALRATDQIADHLVEARLNTSFEPLGRLTTKFGCTLKESLFAEESAAYCETFNAVRLIPEWRYLEPTESHFNWSRLDPLVDWAVDRNLAISVGPLIDTSPGSIPGWLRAGQGDLPTLAAFMDDCVGTIVDRYRDRVRSWQLFSGLNGYELFGISEDDRLRLAARLIESAKQVDPEASWSYRLHQPYGEYLLEEQNNYSPLVFADTLLRSGHEVSAMSLDVGSSHPHDSLDFLQLMDNYEAIVPKLEVELGGFENGGSLSLEMALLRAALSCKSVGAVYWQNWSERQSPTATADAYLYDVREKRPTPSLQEFRTLRNRWLK